MKHHQPTASPGELLGALYCRDADEFLGPFAKVGGKVVVADRPAPSCVRQEFARARCPVLKIGGSRRRYNPSNIAVACCCVESERNELAPPPVSVGNPGTRTRPGRPFCGTRSGAASQHSSAPAAPSSVTFIGGLCRTEAVSAVAGLGQAVGTKGSDLLAIDEFGNNIAVVVGVVEVVHNLASLVSDVAKFVILLGTIHPQILVSPKQKRGGPGGPPLSGTQFAGKPTYLLRPRIAVAISKDRRCGNRAGWNNVRRLVRRCLTLSAERTASQHSRL